MLVNDVVGETVETIKKNEGINKPFCPNNYLYLTMYNILASSAFGRRYQLDDPEFMRIKFINEEQQKLGGYVFAAEFIPILRFIFKKKINLMNQRFAEFMGILKEKYCSHKKDYQDGYIRDFTDALINAKIDSEKNEKEAAPYLTDDNLALTLSDLFSAGSDTSQFTLRWILLLMANHSEMQKKMRKEVDEQIGDRIPVQNDKQNCDYVSAFISECLRYKNIVPLSVPHKTIYDVEIRKFKIVFI